MSLFLILFCVRTTSLASGCGISSNLAGVVYDFRGSVPDPRGPLGGNWRGGGLLFSCLQRCAGGGAWPNPAARFVALLCLFRMVYPASYCTLS